MISSKIHEKVIIKMGIPQGTELGPILFNVYLKSLLKELKICATIFSYADDTLGFS